jgi:hypothetical protein
MAQGNSYGVDISCYLPAFVCLPPVKTGGYAQETLTESGDCETITFLISLMYSEQKVSGVSLIIDSKKLTMKKILLGFLLLVPFLSMAQEDAFGPQKKDDLIIVTTDTVDSQALSKIIKSLTGMGFTIKTKDADAGIVTTNPYDYKKGKMILNVISSLNEIKIYGDYEPNLALVSGANKPGALKDKISFEGAKDSAVKEAWNIMDAFANELTHVLSGTVSYAKR